MTITQAIQLGQTGDEIIQLLDELQEMAEDHDANIDFNDKHEFDSHEHKVEYFGTTVEMIKILLTKLQEK